jgi:hypothetical protein
MAFRILVFSQGSCYRVVEQPGAKAQSEGGEGNEEMGGEHISSLRENKYKNIRKV